jgi:hypothetical protein
MTDEVQQVNNVMYPLLANLVLLIHFIFVVAVISGVPLIMLGGVRGWRWIRLRGLRLVHLAGIAIVAAQSWAGVICPLTNLEMWLRKQGGLAAYDGGFIEYWLQSLLYWNLPPWVFVLAYTAFALLVLLTWVLVPPGPWRRVERHSTNSGPD